MSKRNRYRIFREYFQAIGQGTGWLVFRFYREVAKVINGNLRTEIKQLNQDKYDLRSVIRQQEIHIDRLENKLKKKK